MLFNLLKQDLLITIETYLALSLAIALPATILITIVQEVLHLNRSRTAGRKLIRAVVLFLFLLYLCMVLFLVYLSREDGSRGIVRQFTLGILNDDIYMRSYAYENILLFIPFGFLLPALFWRFRNLFLTFFTALITSAGIEYAQYVTKRGFVDPDDILNNVAGTVAGWIIFTVFYACITGIRAWIRRRKQE